MSSPLNPTPPARPARPLISLRNILIPAVLAVLCVGGVYGYYYYTEYIVPKREGQVDFGTLLRSSLYYLEQASTAPVLPDADGDLVPDPPTDAAKLLDPASLVFVPLSGGSPDLQANWKEFADHVAKTTGKKVEFGEETQFTKQIDDLHSGKLHVAGFSTGVVPAAVRAGFVPAAVPASADGTFGYKMEILVRADSPIKSPADLKGRTLTLTSNGSHSGYKFPLAVLKDKFGLEAQRDYEYNRSGGHEKSITGLAKKEYEAVAVASDILKRAEARGDIKADQYRSIYQSDTMPPGCYGYHYSLKPELAAKVRDAYLKFEWKGTGLEKVFGPSGQTKFAAVDYKKDWQVIRDMDQKILTWARAAGPMTAPKGRTN